MPKHAHTQCPQPQGAVSRVSKVSKVRPQTNDNRYCSHQTNRTLNDAISLLLFQHSKSTKDLARSVHCSKERLCWLMKEHKGKNRQKWQQVPSPFPVR